MGCNGNPDGDEEESGTAPQGNLKGLKYNYTPSSTASIVFFFLFFFRCRKRRQGCYPGQPRNLHLAAPRPDIPKSLIKASCFKTVPGTEQRRKLEHENEYDFFSFVNPTDAFLLRRSSYICVMSRFSVTTYFFLLTNIPVHCLQIFLEAFTFALNVHKPCCNQK